MINVEKLNQYQEGRFMHPFTCRSGNRTDERHLDGEGVLKATEEGWICIFCDYTQEYTDWEERLSQMEPEQINPLTMFTIVPPTGK